MMYLMRRVSQFTLDFLPQSRHSISRWQIGQGRRNKTSRQKNTNQTQQSQRGRCLRNKDDCYLIFSLVLLSGLMALIDGTAVGTLPITERLGERFHGALEHNPASIGHAHRRVRDADERIDCTVQSLLNLFSMPLIFPFHSDTSF